MVIEEYGRDITRDGTPYITYVRVHQQPGTRQVTEGEQRDG